MAYKHRILAVDDNPTNIAVLEELLEETYELRTARTGEEAVQCAPAFSPDLILLDIMMPGMDGYEACRLFRAEPALRRTKIVMVSAKAMTAERLQGYEAGADDYITKPFNTTELLAKVKVYLRLKTVEEVDELKTHVLALLSHETNTPLHGLMLAAELLKEDDISREERLQCAETIYTNAVRLHSLFEKVQKLSAFKAQTVSLSPREGDLNAAVSEVIGKLASLAEKRNVRIEQQLAEPAVGLFDFVQTKEVIEAVLHNAIRLSPDNSCVQIQTSQTDETLLLSVTDQGAGIPPETLPYIFEAFHIEDIHHHSEGHGLSLALAQQILEAQGGTIRVVSTPSSQTTFTIGLPLAVPR